MPAMRTKLHRVTERLFLEMYGVELGEWVAARRGEGVPWRRIEKDLYAKTEGAIDVSHATLITWYPGVDRAGVA